MSDSNKFLMLIAVFSICTLAMVGCSEKPRHTLLISTADWPHAVQQLHSDLSDVDSTIVMDGHLIAGSPGPHSINEAVFRIHNTSPELIAKLNAVLNLVPIEPEHDLSRWGDVVVKNSSNEWWPASCGGKAELFASKPLLDGEEGDLYVVARENSTKTIYICYHFNF